jgi:hypothetical protein
MTEMLSSRGQVPSDMLCAAHNTEEDTQFDSWRQAHRAFWALPAVVCSLWVYLAWAHLMGCFEWRLV